MELEKFDLLIIGGGPIGMACGIEAKKAGLKYAILDKGCLVNSLYHYPLNMTFFSTSERLEIGGVPFISHGNKPNRFEALEYYRRVAMTWDLQLKLYESVSGIECKDKMHLVKTSKATYLTKYIVLATGFYDLPYLLEVKGEELAKVKHYYDEPHPYFGQKLIVVGAGNSAVDVALETYRKGADVTMIVREPTIKESVKYWVKPDIENRIAEGSIKSYFNSNLTEIRQYDVDITTPDGKVTLQNDFVLAMTGYQPNYSFLKQIGIHINMDEMKTPVYDLETQESNVDGIYLAGVVCGGLQTNKWFIENSRVHADIILQDIIKKRQSTTS